MKNFQQRKKFRRVISSRWTFFALLIVTVLLVKGAWGIFAKERETSMELDQTKQNLSEANAREAQLTASIESLKTTQGVEKEIRDKFDVAKSGEEIIMVVDSKESTSTGGEAAPSLWQEIGSWFSSLF